MTPHRHDTTTTSGPDDGPCGIDSGEGDARSRRDRQPPGRQALAMGQVVVVATNMAGFAAPRIGHFARPGRGGARPAPARAGSGSPRWASDRRGLRASARRIDRRERFGDVGVEAGGGRAVHRRGVGAEQRHQARRLEHRPAGDALEEHGAGGVEIGPPVHRLAEELLRRHVLRRAHDHAGGRERLALGSDRCSASRAMPKSMTLRNPAVIHQQVLRLDVAVDDRPPRAPPRARGRPACRW